MLTCPSDEVQLFDGVVDLAQRLVTQTMASACRGRLCYAQLAPSPSALIRDGGIQQRIL